MCLPEIVRGPHQKDILCDGCVCRARTSLDWHLHPQHFESVPRHESREKKTIVKNTYTTTGKSVTSNGKVYKFLIYRLLEDQTKTSRTEPP